MSISSLSPSASPSPSSVAAISEILSSPSPSSSPSPYFSSLRLHSLLLPLEESSALTIQRVYRGFSIRLWIYRLHCSALTIQCRWRQFVSMKRARERRQIISFSRHFALRVVSATCIQSLWRGYRSRQLGYKYHYYKRKKYLFDTSVAGDQIVLMGNQREMGLKEKEMREREEKRAQEFDYVTSNIHHLMSTTNRPGVMANVLSSHGNNILLERQIADATRRKIQKMKSDKMKLKSKRVSQTFEVENLLMGVGEKGKHGAKNQHNYDTLMVNNNNNNNNNKNPSSPSPTVKLPAIPSSSSFPSPSSSSSHPLTLTHPPTPHTNPLTSSSLSPSPSSSSFPALPLPSGTPRSRLQSRHSTRDPAGPVTPRTSSLYAAEFGVDNYISIDKHFMVSGSPSLPSPNHADNYGGPMSPNSSLLTPSYNTTMVSSNPNNNSLLSSSSSSSSYHHKRNASKLISPQPIKEQKEKETIKALQHTLLDGRGIGMGSTMSNTAGKKDKEGKERMMAMI